MATLVVASPTISPLTPNDPGARDNLLDIHDLRMGYGWQDWIEAHPPASGIQDVVALILDTKIDATDIPDLSDQWLRQFSQNFTDEDPSLDVNEHGTNVASAFIGDVNNQMNGIGTAGYKNHVWFVSDKTNRSDGSTNSNWLRAGYQHALDLKTRDHLNIRLIIVSSGGFGDSNPAESLRLIRLLAAQGIMIFAGAGFNGVDMDAAAVKFYPAAYAATEPNVIAVAATDSTGAALDPNSPFGSMIQYAALGQNVQVVDPGDPSHINTGSASGTSVANPLAAGIWAQIWAYRFHQMAKVRRRFDRSCGGPIPKVKCGVPRLGKALEDVPVTLLEGPDGVAIVMESVTNRSGITYPREAPVKFGSDTRNRIQLFVENVDEPLSAAELTVTFEDSTHRTFTGTVEYCGEISQQEWSTQVIVALPADLFPGSVKITFSARGSTSFTTINVSWTNF